MCRWWKGRGRERGRIVFVEMWDIRPTYMSLGMAHCNNSCRQVVAVVAPWAAQVQAASPIAWVVSTVTTQASISCTFSIGAAQTAPSNHHPCVKGYNRSRYECFQSQLDRCWHLSVLFTRSRNIPVHSFKWMCKFTQNLNINQIICN